MAARGRRTKLTAERQDKIVQAILDGNYFETACAYAGVSRNTGFEWLARGENRDPDRRGAAVFAAFANAVRAAEAQAEVRAVAIIQQGFEDNPRLALEFLSRRYPERWGRHDTATVFRQLAEQVKGMSDEDLIAAIESESADGAGEEDAPGGGPAPGPDAGKE